MANVTTEITALRTRDAKHFATDVPGTYVARVQPGQHYRTPAGDWDDTANFVQPVAGGWAGASLDARFGVENGYLNVTYKGRSLSMRPSAVWLVDRTAPAARSRRLAVASYASVARDAASGTVRVSDIFPGVDLSVVITPDSMSKAFTIRSKPTLPDPVALGWDPASTYLVFAWDVQKPAGAKVRVASTGAAFGAGSVVEDDLLVIDPTDGSTVVTFAKGSASGANGVTRPVWYVNAGALAPFGEAIPYASTQTALYPVVVDPTTTIGVGATANDGYMTNGVPQADNTTWLAGSYYDSKTPVLNVYRGFLRFDLASLSGATISAATLYVNMTLFGTATDYLNVYRTASDWYPIANSAWSLGVTLLGSTAALGTATGWKTAALTASGLTPGSVLPLEVRGSIENSTGSNFEAFTDYSGTPANAAYLSITYTTGGTTDISGGPALGWAVGGTLAEAFGLSGGPSLGWAAAGALSVPSPADISGGPSLGWSASGSLAESFALSGGVALGWGAGGAAAEVFGLSGGPSLGWSASGSLGEAFALSGGPAFGWGASGAASVLLACDLSGGAALGWGVGGSLSVVVWCDLSGGPALGWSAGGALSTGASLVRGATATVTVAASASASVARSPGYSADVTVAASASASVARSPG